MKIRGDREAETSELNMTSMIDIVFLLLIFFVMTFKIVEMEGDFSVRMPLAGQSTATSDDLDLPIKLRLRANDAGELTGMMMNDIALERDFEALRANIVSLVGPRDPAAAPEDGPQIEIDADYNLRYESVIAAITAVSGYKQGQQVVPLIERITFAKPRRG